MFIDYQNVHLSAHDQFARFSDPVHQSLIQPARFADVVLAARRARNFDDVDLTEIHVFRGQPSRRHEGDQHSRVQRQASQWTRDRRVKMHLRTLRYPRDWPTSRAQEKGVDVELAIEVVRAAITSTADVIIVATRDTDVLPALALVQTSTASTVELVNWHGQSELKLEPQPRAILLKEAEYRRCRDPLSY